MNGELVEVSRNFYARCTQTGDIYYFGEDVDIYEDGVVVSHDGAWLAGKERGASRNHHARDLPARLAILPGAGARVAHGSRGARQDGAHGDDPGRDVQGVRRGRGDDPRSSPVQSIKRYCAEVGPRRGQRREAGGVPYRGFDD